jgi:predicted transposase/invertase (TIGR01784 family)
MISKEKYINPFTDFGFKKLFGTEANKDLLIDFLNQVMGIREQIRDLTYLNTENLGKTEADRKAVFDLYCENQQGDRFFIELQNVPQPTSKTGVYFMPPFPSTSRHRRATEWDYCLKAVYKIGILNFRFRDKADAGDRYLREVQLLDKQTFEVFYEKLAFIYLEMPCFKKPASQLVTHFDKWLYVVKNLQKLRARPLSCRKRYSRNCLAKQK